MLFELIHRIVFISEKTFVLNIEYFIHFPNNLYANLKYFSRADRNKKSPIKSDSDFRYASDIS